MHQLSGDALNFTFLYAGFCNGALHLSLCASDFNQVQKRNDKRNFGIQCHQKGRLHLLLSMMVPWRAKEASSMPTGVRTLVSSNSTA